MALFSQYTGIGISLDEMSHVRDAASIAYIFSEGEEKGRLTAEVEQRHRRKWQCFMWSTGEKRLEELVEEARKKTDVQSGREARCVDIPVLSGRSITGIVEALNCFKSTAELVAAVGKLADRHYGHAGPEFVRKLIEQIKVEGEEKFSERVVDLCDQFVADLVLPDEVNPLVSRVAKAFALSYAAGHLASELGVVPISSERLKAGVRQCFLDWLAVRGSATKTSAQAKALVTLRDFISQHRQKFINLDAKTDAVDGNRGVSDVVGYVTRHNKEVVYCLTSTSWANVLKVAPRGELVKQLRDVGLIYSGQKRVSVKKRLTMPNGQPVNEYFYIIAARISEIDDNGVLTSDEEQQNEDGTWSKEVTSERASIEHLGLVLSGRPKGKNTQRPANNV